MKYETAIGIDCGVNTGVAIWNIKNQSFEHIYSCDILEVFYRLEVYTVLGKSIFYIENPNLRKWYGSNSNQKQQGAGSIKRDYSIWQTWFERMNQEYKEVNPKNIRTKMDSERFKTFTKWDKQTNSHSRDAAMMVFGLTK